MKFYDETTPLYLETNSPEIGLSAACYKLEMEQHDQGTQHQTTLL